MFSVEEAESGLETGLLGFHLEGRGEEVACV
jgi:hypothetical protein